MEKVIIAAMSLNRVIGHGQKIPWKIPAEQLYFKQVTWGYPLIMGRGTYESIGHPLSGRLNVILSRRRHYKVAGCEVVSSFSEAFALCEKAEKVFIIGGEQVFAAALKFADSILLTTVRLVVEGDVFFPDFQGFTLVERQEVAAEVPYTIEKYQRS